MVENGLVRNAIFSDNKLHRFALMRAWDTRKPSVMFIGLNPSKADQVKDDATIRRVIGFSKSFGYGECFMLNLFSFVSTDPNNLNLKESLDLLSVNNDYLQTFAKKSDKIVFAWGAFKAAENRSKEVIKMFPDAWALKINKDGSPAHPCRLNSNLKLIKYQSINELESIEDDFEDSFQPCDNCDLPDACGDFGCAIKSGLNKRTTF